MKDWLYRLLNEPMADNGWSLALVIVGAMAAVTPLVVMMVRDRRRTTETKGILMDRKEETETTTGRGFAAQVTDAEPAGEEARWAAEGIPPVGDSSSRIPAPMISITRQDCVHCGGRGFMPGISDLLQESIELFADGDGLVKRFYSALFQRAPELAALFPRNPATDDGVSQREKLLAALVALARLYDPADEEKTAHLDQALKAFGRSHAAFVRKGGITRGATLEEYAAVKDALFTTMIRVAAEHWRPEYGEAWSQAYDYAASVMLAEQFRSGFTAPRFPRAS